MACVNAGCGGWTWGKADELRGILKVKPTGLLRLVWIRDAEESCCCPGRSSVSDSHQWMEWGGLSESGALEEKQVLGGRCPVWDAMGLRCL